MNLAMGDFKPEKGSTVEVSSDEFGFHGSWYAATVMDVLDSSPTKRKSSGKKNRNRKKMGYLVRYEKLFEDDNLDEHLTELVEPSFVRPLPPLNVRRNNENKAEAVVVVDAEGGGDFGPFDVIDAFRRDGWWIGEVRKVITDGEIKKYIVSFDDPPEEVEFERSQLRHHVDWIDCRWQVPPKKIPEQELALTPSSKEGQFSGKKKRSSRKKDHIRNAKTVNLVEDSHGSDGTTNVMMETNGSQVIDQDSVLVEDEMIIENNEAEDGDSKQTRKRGRPPILQVKRPSGLQEDGRNMNSSGTTDLDEKPLSVWYQGLHPSSVLKRSLCCSPDESSGELTQQTIVKNGGTTTIITTLAATNYQQDWPFIKRSPIWTTIESLALHQSFTQKPHFSPLEKIREDLREGLAIAYMVTYGNLVHKIRNFKLTDSVDILNNCLQTLGELETHGFDVCGIQAHLNKLLSLKTELGEHEDKMKKVEKEIEKMELNKAVAEVEINQLHLKMQELKEKLVQHNEEITSLLSNLQLVSKKIVDFERAFEDLAATPL